MQGQTYERPELAEYGSLIEQTQSSSGRVSDTSLNGSDASVLGTAIGTAGQEK